MVPMILTYCQPLWSVTQSQMGYLRQQKILLQEDKRNQLVLAKNEIFLLQRSRIKSLHLWGIDRRTAHSCAFTKRK